MIKDIRIQNYKAIRDSRGIQLPLFTTFIGNNGSGKSSVFEALQLLHETLVFGIPEAFSRWGGLENVRNYEAAYDRRIRTEKGFDKTFAAISLKLTCRIDKKTYRYEVGFNSTSNNDQYVVEYEKLSVGKLEIFSAELDGNFGISEARFALSDEEAELQKSSLMSTRPTELRFTGNRLFISGITPSMPDECRILRDYIASWQFLSLNAQTMGFPATQNRLTTNIRLQPDGRNLAEFVKHLADEPSQLDALVSKMKFVLPYASDIQTLTTEDFDRKIQLRLYEEGQRAAIPGWLFSSGTLRVLAILAVMHSPRLPSILFIDEIENGLDPRTIGMLISEIQRAYAQKLMQIIVTTHSPYFLDLVPLDSIIVAEKNSKGCYFHSPKDQDSLTVWRERFSPGKLYTMGKLTD